MVGNILIVTATKTEVQAVLEAFSQAAGKRWTRQNIRDKIYYDLGIHGGAPVYMVQSEPGTATPGGALLTVRQAIQALQPQAIIMCGLAFGLHPDKHQLGDILVAKQLLSYEPQKVDLKQGQMPRGDRTTSAERLLDRFRSGDNDWQGAPTHFGLVVSGEKLVNDPAFRDWLLKTEPEAIGGEMEGGGLYVAARDAKVDWILVKAICDWGDGEKNDAAQTLAARNAAQFVLHVLQLGDWDGPEQLQFSDVMNRTRAATLALRIGIRNQPHPDLPNQWVRLSLEVEITSTNSIASEHGALKLTAAYPVILVNYSTQMIFRGSQFEQSTGLFLEGEGYTPHAQSMKIPWGAHTGNVIFPDDWYNFRGNPIVVQVPNLSLLPTPTYLIQAELFTVNSRSKQALFSIQQRPSEESFEIITVDAFNYSSTIASFWRTYSAAMEKRLRQI